MCLIFFSIQKHPRYKMIVAANRDEFYDRPTEAAHFWKDAPYLLAGRDVAACGSWMGMTRSGKIAMLTNYRDPINIKSSAPSRGALVSDFLVEEVSPEAYLARVEKQGADFNGFNLLVGNVDALWYYSNYRHGIDRLAPGFYGLSNHLLETPWPKVVRGKEKFQPLLQQHEIDPEAIFALLRDEQRAPRAELPHTGLPEDREEALSSMFIKTENYGSRCSTVVLVDYANEVQFIERVYDTRTLQPSTQSFKFMAMPSTKTR